MLTLAKAVRNVVSEIGAGAAGGVVGAPVAGPVVGAGVTAGGVVGAPVIGATTRQQPVPETAICPQRRSTGFHPTGIIPAAQQGPFTGTWVGPTLVFSGVLNPGIPTAFPPGSLIQAPSFSQIQVTGVQPVQTTTTTGGVVAAGGVVTGGGTAAGGVIIS